MKVEKTKSTSKARKKRSAAQTADQNQKRNKNLQDFLNGETISLDTFRKNVWILIPFIAVALALMGLRYKTKTQMMEINRLTTELERSESSKLQEKAEYMSLIRETEMSRLVTEKDLGLQFSEEPQTVIEKYPDSEK